MQALRSEGSGKRMAFSTVISFSVAAPPPTIYLPRNRLPNLRLFPSSIRCCSSISVRNQSKQTQQQFDLKTYWTTLIGEINQKLDEAIPVKYPEQIYEAMRYSVLAKGAKRAPPVMCVAACELFGGNRLAAFPTACALEMVHAASLIHDDIPCMDDATSRRGQPSNHTIYGVDMAILAGDALFPLGYQHIVSHTPTELVPEPRMLRVIAEIARAVGSKGMAAGQFLDLEGGPNSVDFIQEKKFGEMGECSAVCGGLLAGASDDELHRLRRYGRAVGVLYEVVDEVLEAKMTKGEEGNGKRKKEGKNYVAVYGIEKAMEVAEELRAKAKKELDGFMKYGEKVLPLHSFVDYAADRGFSFGDSTNHPGGGGGRGGEEEEGLDQLPAALLCTIISKLDVASICSCAATCKIFRSCASHILTFLPNFHLLDAAPSIGSLTPLLTLHNPFLTSLKADCSRLDDSAIPLLIRPSLHELSLHNCTDFTGKLLSDIGAKCSRLRYLYLGSVAEKRARAVHVSDLEELLTGCQQLEALSLMFDVSSFLRHNFARAWSSASEKLTSLQVGYVSSVMVTEMLRPNAGPHQSSIFVRPSILSGILKLCLSVDYITDTMVGTISSNLLSLTHLDLQDAPLIEPYLTIDLTNSGLQLINQHGKLRHLSLVRRQEFCITYFRRVNDLGMLLMADKCASMESICLGGFCRVTDSGIKTILHSCSSLYKLRVFYGTHLTDLLFHDISATSLSLTHVSLRWCYLLTNHAIKNLVSNTHLKLLDLRDCRNLGDGALRAINTLPVLKILLLDGSDITDLGLSYLRGVVSSVLSLSLRGCKRLTDKCIPALFEGSSRLQLQHLDLSNLPNLTDSGILSLARLRVSIAELRLRQCPQIGDTSVMALASMKVNENSRHGCNLRLLDLYNCGRITELAFRWLNKPYFPKLRWLGVAGCVHRDLVDNLTRNRPFLHVASHAEELDQSDNLHSFYMHDYDEVDELEEWLQGGDGGPDDVDMMDAEDDAELF
ncbi:hypothetical protein Tsubulata_006130 [Turnera subulata]|uniref:F-box domain-containing protein n=1 Tax=Turnera subulata TaxID=218843 RepID=A0A9Q0J3B6_9ROSI|nr:hypothetical protein Tsubulata_006130 [Turnera subulata]